jgi:hypothetical protein
MKRLHSGIEQLKSFVAFAVTDVRISTATLCEMTLKMRHNVDALIAAAISSMSLVDVVLGDEVSDGMEEELLPPTVDVS